MLATMVAIAGTVNLVAYLVTWYSQRKRISVLERAVKFLAGEYGDLAGRFEATHPATEKER